jgi:hypothetical protein
MFVSIMEACIFVIRECMFLLSLVATYQLWRVPLKAGLSPDKGCAADCLQRPLRSRFRQQLTPGVDMTSDVKTWSEKFYAMTFLPVLRCIGRDGASQRRRLILLIFVGWVPPNVRPSGACLALGTRVSFSLFTPSRITPNRGCASSDSRGNPGCPLPWSTRPI